MKPITRTFKSLGLDERLLPGLKRLEMSTPTPIQLEFIPSALENKDILGIAKTGSGKTAAFFLPLIHEWLSKPWDTKNRHVPVLILVPTRELAVQALEVFLDLTSDLHQRPKVMSVFGGVSINPQMKGMSGVQVLIATPGRLLDLIDSKAVHLDELKVLVLDEADKMLNMGFREELDKLLAMMPTQRKNWLLSATLSKEIERISEVDLKSPVTIKIEEKRVDVELIQQRSFRVNPERKGPFLRYLIKTMERY